jgi:hypothetical protein
LPRQTTEPVTLTPREPSAPKPEPSSASVSKHSDDVRSDELKITGPEVIQAYQQLKLLSEKLLSACHQQQVSRIEVCLNKRAELIERLQSPAANAAQTALSVPERQEFEALMASILSLEPIIEAEMEKIKAVMDFELQQISGSKHGVSQYRLETDDLDESFTRDA